MTLDLSFQRAGAGDLPALVALVNSAYRGDSSQQGWTTEADLLHGQRTDVDTLAAEMAEPGAELVAIRDAADALVGCFLLADGQAHHGPVGSVYLGMLTVDPARQAGGVGRAALAEAARRARARGASTLVMSVLSQRAELLGYYRRRGFATTGERLAFPDGDERFGLPQRDDLAFEVMVKPLV